VDNPFLSPALSTENVVLLFPKTYTPDSIFLNRPFKPFFQGC